MKSEILLIGPLLDVVMESLEHDYSVHRFWEADDQNAMLEKLAPTITAVVTDGGLGAKQAMLEKLPHVKAVIVYGVGVDSVALDYCRHNGIAVTNTPDVLSDDVADMGIALMLATSRQLVIGDNYCRSGRWPSDGALPLTTRMSGKRAGILGMGSIGLRLAQRLAAFNMDVSYCNRQKRSDTNYRFYADLATMAKEVDYLLITASASPATQHIVNESILEALGPDGFLINVSRGSLVDEAALITALQQGTIKAAGLDVFENEPSIPDVLLKMKNVVLQPHHASGTLETRRAMGQVVLDNLKAFLNGRPLVTEYFAAS